MFVHVDIFGAGVVPNLMYLFFAARSPGQQQYPARSNPVDGHFLPAGYLPWRGETPAMNASNY